MCGATIGPSTFDAPCGGRHRLRMANLKLTVLSLRYSSWSMRAWLALTLAGAEFE